MPPAPRTLPALPLLLGCAPHVVATRGNEVEVMVYTNRRLREDRYELVSTSGSAIASSSPSRDGKALRFSLPATPPRPDPPLYVRAADSQLVLPERGRPEPKVFTDPLWAAWTTCRAALLEQTPQPASFRARCPAGRGLEPLVALAEELSRRTDDAEEARSAVEQAIRRQQDLLRALAREEEELAWREAWLEDSKARHGAWTGTSCVAPIQYVADTSAEYCEPGINRTAFAYLYCGLMDASVNGIPGTGFDGCKGLATDLVLHPVPKGLSKEVGSLLIGAAVAPLCEAARDLLRTNGTWLGEPIDDAQHRDETDLLQEMVETGCDTLSESPGAVGIVGLTCRATLFLKWAAWDIDPCIDQFEQRCSDLWQIHQTFQTAHDLELDRRICESYSAEVRERRTSIELLEIQLREAFQIQSEAKSRQEAATDARDMARRALDGAINGYNGGPMRSLPDTTTNVRIQGLTLLEKRRRLIGRVRGDGDSWEGVGAGGGIGVVELPNLLLQGVPDQVGPLKGLDVGVHVTNAPIRMGVSLRAGTVTRDDLNLDALGADTVEPVDEVEMTHVSLSGWVDALPLSGASERFTPLIGVGVARSVDTLSVTTALSGDSFALESSLWSANARAGLVLAGRGGRAQLRVTGEQVYSLKAASTSALTVTLDMTNVMER